MKEILQEVLMKNQEKNIPSPHEYIGNTLIG